ncbi:MAG: hypothetical protein WBU92_03510 [Candidatus Dormiibacterota bacterium]
MAVPAAGSPAGGAEAAGGDAIPLLPTSKASPPLLAISPSVSPLGAGARAATAKASPVAGALGSERLGQGRLSSTVKPNV